MPRYRSQLPQLDAEVFLTDGGAETSLIYDQGIELPDFAAFPLVDDPAGREALVRYFEPYLDVARRDGHGIVLETPTWRASPDWASRLGYDLDRLDAANRSAVDLLVELRQRYQDTVTPIVISGCIGPRGDGYNPGSIMSVDETRDYHSRQVDVFAGTEADLATAITMTSSAEAAGIALAAQAVEMPVVISFTVETDGRLPSGEILGEAITEVDAATGSYPAYYMINCAHPSHFAEMLDPEAPWAPRLRGLRANASKLSHAELDEAEELDAGDPDELAADYQALRERLPSLTVLGGCCGTNHDHIAAISSACSTAAA